MMLCSFFIDNNTGREHSKTNTQLSTLILYTNMLHNIFTANISRHFINGKCVWLIVSVKSVALLGDGGDLLLQIRLLAI